MTQIDDSVDVGPAQALMEASQDLFQSFASLQPNGAILERAARVCDMLAANVDANNLIALSAVENATQALGAANFSIFARPLFELAANAQTCVIRHVGDQLRLFATLTEDGSSRAMRNAEDIKRLQAQMQWVANAIAVIMPHLMQFLRTPAAVPQDRNKQR